RIDFFEQYRRGGVRSIGGVELGVPGAVLSAEEDTPGKRDKSWHLRRRRGRTGCNVAKPVSARCGAIGAPHLRTMASSSSSIAGPEQNNTATDIRQGVRIGVRVTGIDVLEKLRAIRRSVADPQFPPVCRLGRAEHETRRIQSGETPGRRAART